MSSSVPFAAEYHNGFLFIIARERDCEVKTAAAPEIQSKVLLKISLVSLSPATCSLIFAVTHLKDDVAL